MKPYYGLIIISIFTFFSSCKNSNKGESEKVDFEVTSQQIYKEYQDNEVAANVKYKDKRVKVTGTLISFVESMGTNYCYIGSPNDLIGEVRCAMSEEFSKQAGNYQKGQQMYVVGKCIGKDFAGVVQLE